MSLRSLNVQLNMELLDLAMKYCFQLNRLKCTYTKAPVRRPPSLNHVRWMLKPMNVISAIPSMPLNTIINGKWSEVMIREPLQSSGVE